MASLVGGNRACLRATHRKLLNPATQFRQDDVRRSGASSFANFGSMVGLAQKHPNGSRISKREDLRAALKEPAVIAMTVFVLTIIIITFIGMVEADLL
jgi:hypothetical protein